MIAIALFAGFGSASAQEEGTDEGVEVTKDMWHKWDGVTKDAQPTDEKVWIDWNIGQEEFGGGTVMCGTSTVSMDVYADLSDYHYLVIYGYGPNPRVMLNRTTDQGQQADGGMIEVGEGLAQPHADGGGARLCGEHLAAHLAHGVLEGLHDESLRVADGAVKIEYDILHFLLIIYITGCKVTLFYRECVFRIKKVHPCTFGKKCWLRVVISGYP